MPKELFFELNREKRIRIINAGLQEFSQHSYSDASTNNIVKAADISKGSLYKYFVNKEDLYFCILDYAMSDLFKDIEGKTLKLKGGIFELILSYAEIEFDWHMKNPDKYMLLKRAFTDDKSAMYNKTVERHKSSGDSFFYALLKDANEKDLKCSKKRAVNILKWMLEGFNQEFMKKTELSSDINEVRKCYVNELKEYLDIIKNSIYK